MFGPSKAQRDEEFSRFVTDAQSSLSGTAWLLTGNREQAADLVQSALVKTYVAWPKVRRADALAPDIARSSCCDCSHNVQVPPGNTPGGTCAVALAQWAAGSWGRWKGLMTSVRASVASPWSITSVRS